MGHEGAMANIEVIESDQHWGRHGRNERRERG
jgi:hypothetical protein